MEESFETGTFPPAGWNVYNYGGGSTSWALNLDLNHTPDGTGSAYHNYDMGENDGYLVSPAINLPASGVMILSFWNYTVDPSYYGRNSLLISTGSGNPANGDFVEVWTPDAVSAEWEQILFNLQSYAGQTVYVAFRYQGDFAHGWAVDDVYVGGDFNTAPKITVNQSSINTLGPASTSITKILKVTNNGVDNLVYTTAITYEGGFEGWLTIDPIAGDIGSIASIDHILTFNPSLLELGNYTATLTITSNDPDLPVLEIPVSYTIIESISVEVSVMIQDYTYPSDISENGEYVSITGFGGADNWLWSKTSGLKTIQGDEASISGVTETGMVAGFSRNPAYIVNGANPLMAGLWNPQTADWTFLPINPAVGVPTTDDYNSAWGISADGTTVVGMQYYPNGDYKAFKWTQSNGFEMIGTVYPLGNRPNGVSNDGRIVYGWADMPTVSRSPVIWTEDSFVLIAPDIDGEAFGASADGEYVTGYAGENGFLWNAQTGTTFFENSLNAGSLSPNVVMNDGTIFGFLTEDWPPFPDTRRAFVRLISGEMMTFNDYAISRGAIEISEWLFFSINGVTPDGNKFIGAAMDSDGQYISFLIDFAAEFPTIVVLPESITEAIEIGGISTQNMEIQNTGNGSLEWETYINYTQNVKATQHTIIPQGKNVRPGKIKLQSKAVKGGATPAQYNRDSYILNYDGENANAVGLIDGGTMYGAARFPANMVNPFIGAAIQSVDLFIYDLPIDASLVIWAAGTTNEPGTILYEQIFSPIPYSWNTITLNMPIELNGSDIWVGCRYTHEAGYNVAGVDGGPANPNGDFVSMDGTFWEHLADNGLDANLNVRAILQLGQGTWLSLSPDQGIIAAGNSENVAVNFNTTAVPVATYTANIIIKSNDKASPIKVIPVTLDVVLAVDENPMAAIKMFPVPASQQLNIELTEGITNIRLFNHLGQKLLDENVSKKLNITLDVSDLASGVYTVQFINAEGKTFSKKILVTK